MDERPAFLEDIVTENREEILGGGPRREKRRIERHDNILNGYGFGHILYITGFNKGVVLNPLHNRDLCLIFPRHETAVVRDCSEYVVEDTVLIVGLVVNPVIIEKFLGGGYVKVPIIVEERLDESTIFDSELLCSNHALLVTRVHGVENVGQLITYIILQARRHIRIVGIFGNKLLNRGEFIQFGFVFAHLTSKIPNALYGFCCMLNLSKN